LAKAPPGAELKAQLQFANVDLDQCLGELFGLRKLEGKGSLGFAIDSSGGNVYDLTKSLNGTANLSSQKGAITGLNVEQWLRRIERRPLSGGEFRNGKTPYDSLTVNLKITQGVANVEEVRMTGQSVGLALTGTASIPDRELDLRGTATLLSSSTSTFELPFMVQGPWGDLNMLWDPLSRMQRSGAAAPLLDEVRKNGPPAVRQAIERFTRGATPAAPAQTVPPAEAAPALAGASAPVETPAEPAAEASPSAR
jgi:AsmA protein